MRFHIRDKIRELESKIFQGYSLWIFRGYVAIDKRGVEKIIDEIYATLPQDMQEAKSYLAKYSEKNLNPSNNFKKSGIYDALKDLETLLDGTSVLSYSIVDKEKFLQVNDKLKNSIPDEIIQAERIDK